MPRRRASGPSRPSLHINTINIRFRPSTRKGRVNNRHVRSKIELFTLQPKRVPIMSGNFRKRRRRLRYGVGRVTPRQPRVRHTMTRPRIRSSLHNGISLTSRVTLNETTRPRGRSTPHRLWGRNSRRPNNGKKGSIKVITIIMSPRTILKVRGRLPFTKGNVTLRQLLTTMRYANLCVVRWGVRLIKQMMTPSRLYVNVTKMFLRMIRRMMTLQNKVIPRHLPNFPKTRSLPMLIYETPQPTSPNVTRRNSHVTLTQNMVRLRHSQKLKTRIHGGKRKGNRRRRNQRRGDGGFFTGGFLRNNILASGGGGFQRIFPWPMGM